MNVMYLSAAALATVLLAQTVEAATVFDRGIEQGDIDERAASDTGENAGTQTPQVVADRFSLGAGATLGSITFSGSYLDNVASPLETFGVVIYEGSGLSPGSELQRWSALDPTRTDTGSDVFGFDSYEYNLDFTDIFLGAGNYFISVIQDDALGQNWGWHGDKSLSGGRFTQDGGSGWSNAFAGYDFSIHGANDQPDEPLPGVIPLPAGLPLMLGGLAAFGLVARRRKG